MWTGPSALLGFELQLPPGLLQPLPLVPKHRNLGDQRLRCKDKKSPRGRRGRRERELCVLGKTGCSFWSQQIGPFFKTTYNSEWIAGRGAGARYNSYFNACRQFGRPPCPGAKCEIELKLGMRLCLASFVGARSEEQHNSWRRMNGQRVQEKPKLLSLSRNCYSTS